MRTAIYTRVSHHRQVTEGHGLETQEARCRAYAQLEGWEVVKVYTDKGVSGGKENRPGLDALRANISDYDRVICFKLSRLGRNARDVHNRIGEFQDHGVEVVFVEDGLDTSRAADKLVIGILAAVAEMEADNNREHATAGMEEAAARGIWQGGAAPYGYQVSEDTGQLELDPDAVDALHRMVDLTLAGKTTQEVADTLNASGSRPPRGDLWKSAEIRRTLRREAMVGRLEWAGIEIEAPEVISTEVYEQVLRILDQTSLKRSRSDVWPLSERTLCSCGGYLIAAGRRNGIRYYRCANHHGDRKGLCTCDHDECNDRPRWWNAEEAEYDAWILFTVLLQDRKQLESAMDAHLGITEGEVDDVLYRKVAKNVETQRKSLANALADRYESDDPETHAVTIETVKERLRIAQTELERLTGLRENQAQAEELREAWLEVADSQTMMIGPVPDPEELSEILQRLNVGFQIRKTPKNASNVKVPGAWLDCTGFLLPSVLTTSVEARPSVNGLHLLPVGKVA